ncbi:biotin-dependent carboxyltransferase family protein [Pullulanibacillus sp. KACC 23026]|uniref:5-oxoprolinase subunit C family protein n=1 Tax=Pullulanibacillus sp. KACC 23026 TaxID=3028315 RepID=UPI0023B201BD|nr:biotin-dependent carboxyltransferase family protein [Pullulanibacillus sp. KACC 23026]WEG14461.1 biotin-dependent carboxyltransferase family protein [Pullulanibacillus sp. KACC 23026]
MIKILSPGLLSTIQDLGRIGYQKFGVIVSGVMDQVSHRIANLLVGNDENDPSIEITLIGPSIEFQEDTLISICGGDLSATINGKHVGLWRPVYVKAGSILSFGPCQKGCRAYLVVAGSYKVPKVMESFSTYMRAGIGGFNGRALKKNDELQLGPSSEIANQLIKKIGKIPENKWFLETEWSVTSELFTIETSKSTIRVMEGRDAQLFAQKSLEQFFSETYEVSPQSDRMGYRLKGPELQLCEAQEMISEAVSFGTIQVPADGQPIILLADRQTTGGYPKIGQVITVDLPKMGQLKPGDTIQFKQVSHQEAQRLFIERESKLQRLKMGLLLKVK